MPDLKTILTSGRKMIETISSSFSVILIASPPSRGIISPAINAPLDH
jgi:hypothetical protein